VFFSLVTFLITDLKALHLRERELARVDDLTKVATRVAFYEFAQQRLVGPEVQFAHDIGLCGSRFVQGDQ